MGAILLKVKTFCYSLKRTLGSLIGPLALR